MNFKQNTMQKLDASLLCLLVLLLGLSVPQRVSSLEAGQYVGAHDDEPLREAVDLSAANDASKAKSGDPEHPSTDNLESLLHWAISNSDHQKLAEQAAEVRQQEAIATLMERKQKVKELINIMSQQPSETQLMKEAIAQLTAADATQDEQLRALEALQILVEPIDNANDLKPLGGIAPVVAALSDPLPAMRAAAAYVLGTAASNNAGFQEVLLAAHPDVFSLVLKLASATEEEVVVKGLYAVAALVRNLDTMRSAFNAAGGIQAVEEVMLRHAPDGANTATTYGSYLVRAKRKALALMMDLTHGDQALAARCIKQGLPRAILGLLREQDHDLQEKALDAMRALMEAAPAAPAAFREQGASQDVMQLHIHLNHIREAQRSSGETDDHYYTYLIDLCHSVSMLLKSGPRTDHTEL